MTTRMRAGSASGLVFAMFSLAAACGAPSTPGAKRAAASTRASSEPLSITPASPLAVDDADDATTPHRRVIAESLRRHDPWNEPLPRGALARLGTTKFDHGLAVAALGPKGSIVSGTTYYGLLQRWDGKTGELLATGKIDGADTFNVAEAMPGGATAVLADYHALYVVDTETLKVRLTKTLFERDGDGSRIEDVAFHPDGRIAVGACSKSAGEALRILDARGSEVMRLHVPPPKESYDEACANRVEFSPDGSLLAAAVNGKAHLYSFPSGDDLASFESGVSVQAIAFSHDGKRLYVGGYGAAVNAFDVKTFKAVRSFGFFDYDRDRDIEAIAVSPDDRFVAINAHELRLYDAATSQELGRLPRISGGKTIVFPSAGIAAYPVTDPVAIGRFDLDKREELGPVDLGRHDGELSSGAFSLDGASAYTAARDGSIRRWSTKNGAPAATWAGDEAFGGLDAVVVAPQSGLVLSVGSTSPDPSGSCELLFHDKATLEVTARIRMAPVKERRCDAHSIAVSRDGARAYVATTTSITSFDLAAKTTLASARIADADAARSPLFAMADGTLAYGAGDRVIFLDPDKLTKKREVKADAQNPGVLGGIAVSPDGKRAVSIDERGVVLVDLATGNVLAKAALPQGRDVWAASFSSDGKRVYAGYRDGSASGVAAFDATTAKALGDLPHLHPEGSPAPRFIAESPDGTRLLEGGDDLTALVLDKAALLGGSP